MYGNYDPWSQQMRNMMNQMATQNNNPQMPLPQPQTVQIPTVHGIEAARNYALPPSSSAIVMDADDLIFNVIITDSNGIKTLKRYKGVEITEENTELTIQTFTQISPRPFYSTKMRKVLEKR